MKSIVICSTQRSGSSFFCMTIKQQNQLGKPTENLLYFERSEGKLNFFYKELKNMSFDDALRVLLEHTSTPNGISSMKVMMSTLDVILKTNNENILSSKQTLNSFKKHYADPSFIFFTRKNKVKQAISHAYLRKTKTAHARTEEEAIRLKKLKQSINLTMNDLATELNYLLKEELKWKLFFLSNNIVPKVVYFENFLEDKSEVLSAIAKFSNIMFCEYKRYSEPLKKISDGSQKKLEIEFVNYLKKNYDTDLLIEYGFDVSKHYP